MSTLPEPRTQPRQGHRFRVALLLRDTPLRRLVGVAIEQLGAVPVVYDEARLRASTPTAIAALVLELQRPLSAELVRLQDITQRFVHAPVLVYGAHASADVPGVGAQGTTARHLRLSSFVPSDRLVHDDVEWLLRAIPPLALTWLVLLLLADDLPLLARGYVAEQLWRAGMGPADVKWTVTSAAGTLGTSRGVLEHTLHRQTPLAPPKDLANWLTLLLVTYTARGRGRSAQEVSKELGFERHRWGRLQARLVASYPAFAVLPAATQFDLALVAFAEQCRVARSRVTKALRLLR